jgi:hypothetical protein
MGVNMVIQDDGHNHDFKAERGCFWSLVSEDMEKNMGQN